MAMAKDVDGERKKKKKSSHHRSRSCRYVHFGDNNSTYKVARKLGPRAMGRIKYKGTKYNIPNDDDDDFLKEKIHHHARSSSFHLRKQANLSQVGVLNNYKLPKLYKTKSAKIPLSALKAMEINTSFSLLKEWSDSSEISELSDDRDEEMSDALSDFIDNNDEYSFDESLDEQIEGALIDILAPTPSPPPVDKKKIDRKQLLQKVQMNLDDVREKHIKSQSMSLSISFSIDNKTNNEEIMKLADDIQKDMNKDILDAVFNDNKNNIHHLNDKNDKNEENDEKKEKNEVNDKNENINKDKKYKTKIPSNFICPISENIINEAVMASDGRIYDRKNMENWLKTNDISPVSKQKLRHKLLMPFNELTEKISDWKRKNKMRKKRKRKKRKRKNKQNTQKMYNSD